MAEVKAPEKPDPKGKVDPDFDVTPGRDLTPGDRDLGPDQGAVVTPMAINTSTYVLTRYDSERGGGMMGKLVFDATAVVATDFIEINCGFKPRYVKLVNVTDRIACEYYFGMADNTSLKTAAAGTVTLEAKGITLTNRGFRVSQDSGLALIAASKTLHFMATP